MAYARGEEFAYFNPRHPYGWRHRRRIAPSSLLHFNPRHPYGWRRGAEAPAFRHGEISIHATHTGGDPPPLSCTFRRPRFQSTPPIRVATLPIIYELDSKEISIHATHTGGDVMFDAVDLINWISIHATHTGGDALRPSHRPPSQYFNPRHPYGWRRIRLRILVMQILISIHATHTGGDK